MDLLSKVFKHTDELAVYLKAGKPTFYHASKTSTVVPYEKLENHLASIGVNEFVLGDLSSLEESMVLNERNELVIRGAVTWKDAREFCQSKGRQIMTSPTEELAAMLSGVATSCTGERCFGFGTLRDQLIEVSYLDYMGNIKTLCAKRLLKDHALFANREDLNTLQSYQDAYQSYKEFKNAPFPRLEVETDLMTGTEGQLGVIIEGVFKTAPAQQVNYIFIALPKWEQDSSLHQVVFEEVQPLRDRVLSCELIDENSWNYLEAEDIPRPGKDIIFLEIDSEYFEDVYEKVLIKLSTVLAEEDIFEVPESRCRELRMKIPRQIFEANAKMGVTKKGTDVQVRASDFSELLNFYKEIRVPGVEYNLFGHFGDAHLHFNYMPTVNDQKKCQVKLEELYNWVLEKKGSPFAEHGIGLIKIPFIKSFYGEAQLNLFSLLKSKMDPKSQFFPQGFMMESTKSE